MTDVARAEITNGIWLCRNCHKLVDGDPDRYSVDLLFAWREDHERYVLERLGSRADQISAELTDDKLRDFENYPAIVHRIVRDMPDLWEYRITSELLRFLNEPHFRKIRDLEDGLYTLPIVHVSEDESFQWCQQKIEEMSQLLGPWDKLLERLNESWGEPGEPGSLRDIFHYCNLLSHAHERIVEHEEGIRFTRLAEPFEPVRLMFLSCIADQMKKFETIPAVLDAALEEFQKRKAEGSDETVTVLHNVTMQLPDGWVDETSERMRLAIEQSYGAQVD